MTWFDILKKLTTDEMGAVAPYIRDELEENEKKVKRVYMRLYTRLGRAPTKEELKEELTNPAEKRKRGGSNRKIRPNIKKHPAYQRLIHRLKRAPTDEELRQEISNPTKRYRGRPIKRVHPEPEVNKERFPLFDNIKLYLESQNIKPTIKNMLAELTDSDKVNPEQDVIDIGEYLETQRYK